MVMRGGYDRRRRKGWTVAEWFIRKGKGWRRSRERVEEVAWSGKEIRQSLRRAGFGAIRAWDEAPFLAEWKISPGYTTIFLARKAPGRQEGPGSPGP